MIVKQAIFKILILTLIISALIPFAGNYKNSSEVFAQWLDYYPQYPNRIKYIVSELNQNTQDLEYYNQELNNQVSQCSCANAASRCIRGSNLGVFGDPCNNREEIKKTQAKIKDKISQVEFTKKLLQTEMENGLAEELERIDPEEAVILEEGLNNIVASTDGVTNAALKNVEIVNNESYSSGNQCQAQCNQMAIPVINACVFSAGGGQKPITMGFEIGIGLEDLDLGGVRIDEIELNLPERIQMSDASNMEDFTIGLDSLTIDFPKIPTTRTSDFALDPIVFHPPSPSIPVIPPAGFSCNQLNVNAFSCEEGESPTPYSYTNLEWFLQTFSWLSNKCQELPGLTDENGNPVQEKYEECFAEETAHTTIINQCASLWQAYSSCKSHNLAEDCILPPGVCSEMGSSKSQAINKECRGLYEAEGESAPGNCGLSALENKCEQIKETNRKDIPTQCRFLPLFNGVFEDPGIQTYQGSSSSCAPQTLSSNSQGALRLDCPSVPSFGDTLIPKIKLPDIIIPDIELPSFEFMPFVRVGLPSLIFEDLILDDLEFCSLDNCKRAISSIDINFQYPSLRIPDIDIPTLYADMPKIPSGPQIEPLPIDINKIKFPAIPIPMPAIDLADLISLNMDLDDISLPEPEVIMNFTGVEIDMGNMLLGLVSSLIPIPNGCVSAGISGLPLGFDLPDYHFYWPRFPEVPDLCNNKYISIDNFCNSVSNSLERDINSKVDQIEDILNNTIQAKIQNRLDSAATMLEDLIKESIHEQVSKIKTKVENAVADSVSRMRVNDGMFEIPQAYTTLDNINVAMDNVNAELAKIANEITIPWPDDLKRIPLTKVINYDLPSIPLSDLSYTKRKTFNLPGFQGSGFDFDVEVSGLFPGYEGINPSGGTPYPTTEINVNINELVNINQGIQEASSKIYDVLY